MMMHADISTDREVFQIIREQEMAQKRVLNMRPGANYASLGALQGSASVLTNKYCSGELGGRHYGGVQNIDRIEGICKQRALALFGLDPEIWDVNVHLLSVENAKLAVFLGFAGGSGRILQISEELGYAPPSYDPESAASHCFYTLRRIGFSFQEGIDYAEVGRQASDFAPDIVMCERIGYTGDIDYARLRGVLGSGILAADISYTAGMAATRDTFEHCDVVATSGHNILRGPKCAMIFYKRTVLRRRGRTEERLNVKDVIDYAVYPCLQGGIHCSDLAALATSLKQSCSAGYRGYIDQSIKNTRAFCRECKRLGLRIQPLETESNLAMVVLDSIDLKSVEEMFGLIDIGIMYRRWPFRENKGGGIPYNTWYGCIFIDSLALTTRGLGEAGFAKVARIFDRAVQLIKKYQHLMEDGCFVGHSSEKYALLNQSIAELRRETAELSADCSIPVLF